MARDGKSGGGAEADFVAAAEADGLDLSGFAAETEVDTGWSTVWQPTSESDTKLRNGPGKLMAGLANRELADRMPSAVFNGLSADQQEYVRLMYAAAHRYGVPPELLTAWIAERSGLNAKSVDRSRRDGLTGYGIAQYTTADLARLNKTKEWALDPKKAIVQAAKDLAKQLATHDGDPVAAILALEGGDDAVNGYFGSDGVARSVFERVKRVMGGAIELDPSSTAQFGMAALSEFEASGGGSAGKTDVVALSSAAEIGPRVDAAAREVLGRKATDEEKRLFVALVHGEERRAQSAAIGVTRSNRGSVDGEDRVGSRRFGAGGADTTIEIEEPGVDLEGFLRERNPEEAYATDTREVVSTFMKMLSQPGGGLI